jgi:hypothetical protein
MEVACSFGMHVYIWQILHRHCRSDSNVENESDLFLAVSFYVLMAFAVL